MINLSFGIILELIALFIALMMVSWLIYLLKTTKNTFHKANWYFLISILVLIIIFFFSILSEMNNLELGLLRGIGYIIFVVFLSVGIYKLKCSVDGVLNHRIKNKKRR